MLAGSDNVDAIVIGGGPAGATAAARLARQDLSVVLFEKRHFPRFHIGESLLPGSLPIFQELGVYDEIDARFIRKPGGKWYYGDRPVFSDFALSPDNTSFAKTRYAYMVKRAEFDEILLRNAERLGARVFLEHSILDLLEECGKVVGVAVRDDKTGQSYELRGNMVFDCSGFAAFTAKKFGLRKPNPLKTMAVFAHYRTEPLDKDVKNGWIVAPMLYNSWVWMIPLEKDLVSVGAVTPLDQFKQAQRSPRRFLERYIQSSAIVSRGLGPNPALEGKVRLYGNLGYSTARACGEGWVLVGDAAFFIDPCYSTGVHLALLMAKKAVEVYVECRRTGRPVAAALAEKYEPFIRREEQLALRLVDAFYMSSRNRVLRWLIPAGNIPPVARQFAAVTGGDLLNYPHSINLLYYMCKTVSRLLPLSAAHRIGISRAGAERRAADSSVLPAV
jgi:flavin-dependent dehydrogenase